MGFFFGGKYTIMFRVFLVGDPLRRLGTNDYYKIQEERRWITRNQALISRLVTSQ